MIGAGLAITVTLTLIHAIISQLTFVFRDTIDEDTRKIAAVLLEQEQYRYLVDFDNHLDHMANDWRNVKLNELISKCT